ncbi:hypothetical protein BCV70DRAFT_214304 [Testicularia cyperi]|uniref:BZIP domain-containing protein n=1 Tax=Testicularia cyperi TaxID=1882483 RepID=A0A317XWX1_9BASI|nr:hypothetical protein BCV70DRAFT_214304 [Testicularia cyperi]
MSTTNPAEPKQRTRNAQAQADLRARRKNYIKTLEDTVSSLESCVRQLRAQNDDLLSQVSSTNSASPPSSSASTSSADPNLVSKLRAENARLHQILADVGLAAAAATKLAKVGKDAAVGLPSVNSLPSPPASVAGALEEIHSTPPSWNRTKSITNKRRRVSQTRAFADDLGHMLTSTGPGHGLASVSTSAAPALWSETGHPTVHAPQAGPLASPEAALASDFDFDTDLSFLDAIPTVRRPRTPAAPPSDSISTSTMYSDNASPVTPTEFASGGASDLASSASAPALSAPIRSRSQQQLHSPSIPALCPTSAQMQMAAQFLPFAYADTQSATPMPPPPQIAQAWAAYAWNCWQTRLQSLPDRKLSASTSLSSTCSSASILCFSSPRSLSESRHSFTAHLELAILVDQSTSLTRLVLLNNRCQIPDLRRPAFKTAED